MTRGRREESPAGEALGEAHSIQAAASLKGFDWPDISGAFEKVHEEIEEIREALAAGREDKAKEELGDLLFAVVNLSRFLDAPPAQALRGASEKFMKRFVRVEADFEARGQRMADCPLEELDVVWERVKEEARSASKKGLT